MPAWEKSSDNIAWYLLFDFQSGYMVNYDQNMAL